VSEPAADGPDPTVPAEPVVGEPSDTDSSTGIPLSASDVPSAISEEGTDPIVGDSRESEAGGDPGEQGPSGDGGAESVVDVLAATEAERDGYLADLQRMTAEFANYRKQADRRTLEVGARARGDLVEKLLPVLDACDLAIEHGAEDVAPIRSSLVHSLEPVGLEVLDPAGQPFDPTRHEAVLHEPADEGDDGGQVVAEVLRRGYAWEGRVLRPAMVRVQG